MRVQSPRPFLFFVLLLVSIPWAVCAQGLPLKVTFPSRDQLTVTADLYMVHPRTAPMILLFHRAGWSRGEYRPIAPKLNRLGFNCLAVDLRSGGEGLGVINETARLAKSLGRATTYLDAYQDMEAALERALGKWSKGPVVLWGSSYSASLALILGAHHQKELKAVLAFSPGEYFTKLGKSPTLVRDSVRGLTIPVFITSAGPEEARWKAIYQSLGSTRKRYFLPFFTGAHGSQALWPETEGSALYWDAVETFLGHL